MGKYETLEKVLSAKNTITVELTDKQIKALQQALDALGDAVGMYGSEESDRKKELDQFYEIVLELMGQIRRAKLNKGQK